MPYGETRYVWGSTPTDRRFTGQREEAALGSLYDYGARFYSPSLNRFISPDTIVPSPGNPADLNRYSYARGNPLKYTDPTGHFVDEGPFCFHPGCSYDPFSNAYYAPPFKDTGIPVESNTYFLSPAESKEILGVAVAQRVSQGTVGKANDPNDIAMMYVMGALGFAGFAGNFGTVSGATVPGTRMLAPGPGESSMNGADAIGNPDCVGCGYALPNDAIVYQYQANPPRPGKAPKFNDSPRPGEKALSCQYGPACGNNPRQGLAQAFNGRSPKPGEHYRWTTIGKIQAVGRQPVYDGGLGRNPTGHLSIYGDSAPEAFHGIWNGPIPFE